MFLQLADSAFPAGGFAHSAGLEAAVHAGAIRSVRALNAWLEDALWNVGNAMLPFVASAHHGDFAAVDAACDRFIVSAVANRASRTQGRAFVETCVRSFPHPALTALRADATTNACHHAPAFGASAAILGLAREEAEQIFLHAQLRGATSAAVRLGVIGPHLAQRLHHDLHPTLERVARACGNRSIDAAAVTAPLQDLFGATHDRLYSRLFQS